MNQETKYQLLIIKIQEIKAGLTASEFSPSELELIAEALETVRFLEIIFKVRKERNKGDNPFTTTMSKQKK